MEFIALLRGVTPVGKNRIPKMSYLAEILETAEMKQVRTYIQSGNVLLRTEMSKQETSQKIHDIIKEKIGADLSVIMKTKAELEIAIAENPFAETYDYSRIHLVFTNDKINQTKVDIIKNMDFQMEEFHQGSQCLYIYLPREAPKKKLNTNFLEKKLGIVATMRKMSVVEKLSGMVGE